MTTLVVSLHAHSPHSTVALVFPQCVPDFGRRTQDTQDTRAHGRVTFPLSDPTSSSPCHSLPSRHLELIVLYTLEREGQRQDHDLLFSRKQLQNASFIPRQNPLLVWFTRCCLRRFTEFFLLLNSRRTLLCRLSLAIKGGDKGTLFFNMFNTNSLTALIWSALAC